MTTVSSEPVLRSTWWRPVWGNYAIRQMLTFGLSLLCALAVWSALAWWVGKPAFLPSPLDTLKGAGELIENGQLAAGIAASLTRVAIGFTIGTLIGIPLGLLINFHELKLVD